MSDRVGGFDRNVNRRSVEIAIDEVDERPIFVSVFQRHIHFVQHAELARLRRLPVACEDVLRVHVHAQFVHAVQQRFVNFAEARVVLHRVNQFQVLRAERVEVRAAFVSHKLNVTTKLRRVLLGEGDVIGLPREAPRH